MSSKIQFIAGKDKRDRARYVCGDAAVGASLVTRVLKVIKGKSTQEATRVFIGRFERKSSAFLAALDAAGIPYGKAIEELTELSRACPEPARNTREAIAIAKALVKRYWNLTPEKMFDAFLVTAAQPEFRRVVVGLLEAAEAQHGRNARGKIYTRSAQPKVGKQPAGAKRAVAKTREKVKA